MSRIASALLARGRGLEGMRVGLGPDSPERVGEGLDRRRAALGACERVGGHGGDASERISIRVDRRGSAEAIREGVAR